MRTRSQASAENSVIGKRRTGDDVVALEDGNRRKRRRVLSPRQASYKELSRHSSAAEGNCFPCAKKSSLGKRNKGVESAQGDGASNTQAHEAPDQEMIRCSPKIAEVLCTTMPFCREDNDDFTSGSFTRGGTSPNTHNLACSAMVVKTSTAETSKSINQRDGSDTAIELGPAPAQNHSIEQCSSSFKRNFITYGTSVQEYLHEQNRATCEEPTRHSEIVGTAVLPPKLSDTHCQSEKGNSNEGSPTLTRKGAEKRACTASMKRKHTHPQSHSAPRRKQSKNSRRAKKTEPMPIKSKKPSLRGVRAAKLRWTHLMQSIINAKNFPGCTSDNKLPHSGVEQTMTFEEYPSNETRSLHKRRKRLEHGSLSTAQKRPKISKQQQKVGKQLRSLMRWIKTWLIQAKFSQITSTNGQNGNDMGEAFIMMEDERNAFAKTMAKSCRQNEKLKTLFLESVRVLTMSKLMHATASTMLQEETCEEAQMLMDAWAEAKVQDDAARPLPMNLLKAMNQINCSGLLPNVVIHYLQVSQFTQLVSRSAATAVELVFSALPFLWAESF
ncbi:hypothetical protein L7F22_040925 [Adiantum nelumboides]|nr:hypothetical protein [Adiantum nelumboides]